MQAAAVILAAGASTRFGSPKQLARIGGRTLLDTVAAVAREAGLHPIIAVVPAAFPVRPELVPVVNDAPQEGLSRSLRMGVAAVPPEAADAAIILLGDQPTVDATTLGALLDAGRSGAPVAAAEADGRMGPPVLLARRAFALAEGATGDEGLRSILAGLPRRPSTVEVGEQVRDVDTPADLEALGERCHGCGALFHPVPAGATHEYIGSTAACWASFGEVLAREFQDPAYGWIHRHTVDAYTVQHPGLDDRRQRQSVALHLVGLCHWLEHGLTAAQLNPITQRLANETRDWPWLEPPSAYDLTVLDVLRATSGEEHAAVVRAWAESVWGAWSTHHAVVREWASGALRSQR